MKFLRYSLLVTTTLFLMGAIDSPEGVAIDVPEPSGVVRVGSDFFVISDTKAGRQRDNKIFKLDAFGNVVERYFAGAGVGNFEGITFHDGQFYLLDEDGVIYVYSRQMNLVRHFSLSKKILKYVEGSNNAKFESIVHDGVSLLVGTEKGPKYFIRIDDTGNEVAKWDLSKLGLNDISDITYFGNDRGEGWFYVVSHESRAIAGFPSSSLSKEDAVSKKSRGNPIQPSYAKQVQGNLQQLEGISFDGMHFVLVSDKDQRMVKIAY